MTADELVPLDEASGFFPRPIGKKSIYKRIHEGIEGVRLGAVYDGYRYYTSQERVQKFLQEVSDAQNKRFERLCMPILTREEEYRLADALLKSL